MLHHCNAVSKDSSPSNVSLLRSHYSKWSRGSRDISGVFNLERWAYNIPLKFLHDIKSGPKTGKAAKEHLENVLSMNLPSEAKHLPPMRLAQYLGPEVCKTMHEKTKKYRHGKQKRDRSSAPSTEPNATPEPSLGLPASRQVSHQVICPAWRQVTASVCRPFGLPSAKQRMKREATETTMNHY